MTNEWLNKEPAQGIGRRRTKNGRIRLLEERVAKLEEEVRMLTPVVSITPMEFDPAFTYGPLPLPVISTGGPAHTAGTFRGIETYGYPETTG